VQQATRALGLAAAGAILASIDRPAMGRLTASYFRCRCGHPVGPRPLCLLGALALLVIVPAQSFAATQTRQFVAWKDGKPTTQVVSRRNGDCFTNSTTNTRFDAWRCIVGSSLYDPCFENLDSEVGEVLCVSTPWESKGRIVFSDLDPSNRNELPSRPWAVKLGSGKRCSFIGGATAVSRGRRLNYVCRSGDPCPCLYGVPNRSKPTWRIFQAGLGGANWHRVKIAVAWR
jgi:hypothetical protein